MKGGVSASEESERAGVRCHGETSLRLTVCLSFFSLPDVRSFCSMLRVFFSFSHLIALYSIVYRVKMNIIIEQWSTMQTRQLLIAEY